MVDKIIPAVVTAKDMKCANCTYGHQIVAGAVGGNIDEEGNETRWRLVEPIKIGQTRNCLNWWQRRVLEISKYVYPNEDDTCINQKKFKKK